jgi:hypothetical protein
LKTLSKPFLFAVLFVLFAILYAVTIPQRYTYDGLCYALDLQRAPVENLFHPNHLLYSFAQNKIWMLVGHSLKAIFVMQAANVLIAALAVACYGGLLAGSVGTGAAFVMAALWGVSQAFWTEAADPGCYAYAALAVAFFFGSFQRLPNRPGWLSGFFQGFLMLWHQMLILLVPVSLWRVGKGRRIGFLSALLLTVVLPYAWVAHTFHGPSLRGELFWALGPAGPSPGTAIFSRTWWSTDCWSNAGVWFHALGNAIVFKYGMVAAPLLLALAIVGLYKAPEKGEERAWAFTIAVAFGVLSLFQFFFYIGALRYRILALPFLLALCGRALKDQPRAVLGLGWVGVLFVAWFNGMGPVRERHRPSSDTQKTVWLNQQLGERDFFLFGGTTGSSIDNVYVAYFAPQLHAQSLRGYSFSHPNQSLTPLLDELALYHQHGIRIWTESDLAAQLQGWTTSGTPLDGPEGYRLVLMTPETHAK